MKRILVPLDGTTLAAAVIGDARQLAGPDGELVLVQDVLHRRHPLEPGERDESDALDASYEYLDRKARRLRDRGVKVRVETLLIADTAVAIDEAARIFNVDMIACATHGRGPFGRLVRGGVAWRAMANSPVPVLLRHAESKPVGGPAHMTPPGRILVPLDGSRYSETALPLAVELARQWDVDIVLEQVIPDLGASQGSFGYSGREDLRKDANLAQDRLEYIAARLPVQVSIDVCTGPIVESLVVAVARHDISHVVMASHGRTGLSRVIVGSVADALIHELRCPIFVIPAIVAHRVGEELDELHDFSLAASSSA
jgi:nucleotide-binding universal stress UspA family protein